MVSSSKISLIGLICFLLGSALPGLAQQLTYVSFSPRVDHGQNPELIVEDLYRNDPVGNPVEYALDRTLAVNLIYGREQLTDMEGENWSYRVYYELTKVTTPLASVPFVTNDYVTITNNSSTGLYEQLKSYDIDHGKISLRITQIEASTDEFATVITDLGQIENLIPEDIRLEMTMEVRRYDFLNPDATLSNIGHQYDQGNHKLDIQWSFMPGAQYFELEWAYIDGEALTEPTGEDIFENAVRVEVLDNHYEFPITYPVGKLYYRVRPVGRYIRNTGTDYTHLKYGAWTQGGAHYDIPGFENNRHWQYTVNFAEEGKNKKIINYFDEGLKPRQTQTNLSTEELTLVQTNHYDVEGRATLNVLPVPDVTNNNLFYKSDFNGGYGRADFDKETPGAMTTATGAGFYYSTAYGTGTSPEMYKEYIPDAGGFPMSQMKYLNDGTGRLAKQSGVGAFYKIDSDRAVEYFYDDPSSTQLHRLFGSEVGEAKYYQRNIVKDANGQLSVAYVDAAGRTIATALAGASPDNVQALDSEAGGTVTITEDLTANNVINEEDGISTITSSLMNEFAPTTYNFEYSFTGIMEQLTNPVSETDPPQPPLPEICESCEYKIDIEITDPDGNPVLLTGNTGDFGEDADPVSGIDNCHQMIFNSPSYNFSAVFNQIGLYKITKTLTVVPKDLESLMDEIETGKQSWIANIYDPEFALMAEDYLDCAITCDHIQTQCEKMAEENNLAPGTGPFDDFVNDCMDNFDCDKDAEAAVYNEAVMEECESILAQIQREISEGGCCYNNGMTTKEQHPDYPKYVQCKYSEDSRYFDFLLASTTGVAEVEYLENQADPAVAYWTHSAAPTVLDWDFVGDLVNIDPVFNIYPGTFDGYTVTATATQVRARVLQILENMQMDPDKNWRNANHPDFCVELRADLMIDVIELINCRMLGKTDEEKWRRFLGFYKGAKEQAGREFFDGWKGTNPQITMANCPSCDDPDIFGNVTGPDSGEDYLNELFGNDLDVYCADLCAGNVEAWMTEIGVLCPAVAGDQTLRGHLTDYCSESCGYENPIAFILSEDIAGNSHLTAAQNIITNAGCSSTLLDDDLAVTGSSVYETLKAENGIDDLTVPIVESFEYSDCYFDLQNALNFDINSNGGFCVLNNDGSPNGYHSTYCNGLNTNGINIMITMELVNGEYFLILDYISPTPSNPSCWPKKYKTTKQDGSPVRICDYDELSNFSYTNFDEEGGFATATNTVAGTSETIYFENTNPNCVTDPLFYSIGNITTSPVKVLSGTTVEVNLDQVFEACSTKVDLQYAQDREEAWQEEVNRRLEKVLAETDCFRNPFKENFSVNYQSTEHHYTLYYYDQAGNLVQTIPPNGVHPLEADQFNSNGEWIGGIDPQHEEPTQYKFNSANQLTEQNSANHKGVSTFYYDAEQRLRLSQDARQAVANNYSYTKYDEHNRVTEVGQITGYTLVQSDLDNPDFPGAGYSKTDIVTTVYNEDQGLTDFPQENLRNRIAMTSTTDAASIHTCKTYYSYDAHGNVKSLYHDITEAWVGSIKKAKIEYDYDLISGNVNEVRYQPGEIDEFYHRYEYDADNRITHVYTSEDSIYWEEDARYFYYAHGPLARMEVGHDKVQGSDYAYTLQGWIKSVNMPAGANPETIDPAMDGNTANTIDAVLKRNSWIPKDEFSYALGYNQSDYTPIGTVGLGATGVGTWTDLGSNILDQGNQEGLFNGNIAWMVTNIPELDNGAGAGMQAMAYQYDALHRIKQGLSYGYGTGWTSNGIYNTNYTYDGNGNLQSLYRNGPSGVMDDLDYKYMYEMNPANPPNQLYWVDDAAQAGTYPNDVDDQSDWNNYVYDEVGNLMKDVDGGITWINWSPSNKVKLVNSTNGDTRFSYDGAGNRLSKWTGSGDYELYIRDASGNVMAIYEKNASGTHQKQVPLFGSSRLGMRTFSDTERPEGGNAPDRTESYLYKGNKRFELSNHLGNVLATVKDRKFGTDENTDGDFDYYKATVVTAQDYYPFGMDMPGRGSIASGAYRYGFNGKEQDTDGEWGGLTQYDYGFRIYNPGIAKFLSVDPLAPEYPELTPYQFASNRPIDGIDLDGLEYFPKVVNNKTKEREVKVKLKLAFQDNDKTSATNRLKIAEEIERLIGENMSGLMWDGGYLHVKPEITVVSSSEIDINTDYHIELVHADHSELRKRKAAGVTFSSKKAIVGSYYYEEYEEGGFMLPDGSYEELKTVKRQVELIGFEEAALHEFGHMLGLAHAFPTVMTPGDPPDWFGHDGVFPAPMDVRELWKNAWKGDENAKKALSELMMNYEEESSDYVPKGAGRKGTKFTNEQRTQMWNSAVLDRRSRQKKQNDE